MDKFKVFEVELNYIRNPSIRKFTEEVLKEVPEYFWHIGSSSTNKYHPSYALGEGGLIRHTQAAVRIVLELFRLSEKGYTDEEKDIVISALILHDTAKLGFNGSKHTITEHPLEIVKFFNNKKELKSILSKETLQLISNCISSHMGRWDYNYKTKKRILPRPKTRLEQITHMADYIASRKCLEFNFNVEIKRD